MKTIEITTTTSLAILVVLVLAAICLQIFLSKRRNKWLGLILPIILFLQSLLVVANLAIFEGMDDSEIFMLMGIAFILANIPTVVFGGIYLACREKIKARDQLERMNIQDLE